MAFDIPTTPPRRIGIVGTRTRDSIVDLQLTIEAFRKIHRPGDMIVSGGCPQGGDRFAELIARKRGLVMTTYYPDWDGVGRGAGFARNQDIADNCDILIAVVSIERKGGTEDTIARAQKLGKQIILV